MFRDLLKLTVLGALCAGLVACDDGAHPTPEPTPEPEAPAPEAPKGIVPSHNARVKFKAGERMLRDLTDALKLDREGSCLELARYDCVTDVHSIALGGVEPYHKQINKPLEVMPVTAAIAADRVALSTCTRRMQRDFAKPDEAEIFTALVGASGVPEADALQATARTLYDRILRRDATDDEVQALVDFHAEVMAESGDDGRERWAQLSCFAVATTLEALFY